MGQLDEILTRLSELPDEERSEVERRALEETRSMLWVPNPGAQTEAYFSEADELAFGGEAGPGKTDLLLGLSLNEHAQSLLLRRTNKEVIGLIERMTEIVGSRSGYSGKDGIWRLPGRAIELGGCEHENDKQKYKGRPHDLIGIDEVVDFTESQYLFITTWNRSSDPNQRCRIVATLNPPTAAVGLWVLRRWAPWLDPKHPRPARSGELRWFTSIDGEDTEVDGRGPHIVAGREVFAKSRTFIRGRLNENPDLANSGYEGRLAGLPEELREVYLEGKFEAALRDAPNQTIPTAWVRAAQERWVSNPPPGVPMCAIGVDASGGGKDPMIIQPRYDGWFSVPTEIEGKDMPMESLGTFGAGQVIARRRDNALVVIDMGGGYGGSMYEHLKDNGVECAAFKGAEASTRRSRDGKLRFTNKRTAAYWFFREALDPGQPGGSPIMLPDHPRVISDLTAPTFEVTPRGIKLEPKDSVVERLGQSPDYGDAIVMCWFEGPRETTAALEWAERREQQSIRGRRPRVVMGHGSARGR